MLVRACLCGSWHRPEGFVKPPWKFWNLICPKAECTNAYGTQRTSQICKITSIVHKKSLCAHASLVVRWRAEAGRFGKPPQKLHFSSCLHENAEHMEAMGTHICKFLNQIERTRKRNLWPLCVKSLRVRASLLVRRWAQAGRFGKPPRKLHSIYYLHMDAMGTHICKSI